DVEPADQESGPRADAVRGVGVEPACRRDARRQLSDGDGAERARDQCHDHRQRQGHARDRHRDADREREPDTARHVRDRLEQDVDQSDRAVTQLEVMRCLSGSGHPESPSRRDLPPGPIVPCRGPRGQGRGSWILAYPLGPVTTIELTPRGPSPDDVVAVARAGARAVLSAEARSAMAASAAIVERLAVSDEPVYGVSTAFGSLAHTPIPAAPRAQL